MIYNHLNDIILNKYNANKTLGWLKPAFVDKIKQIDIRSYQEGTFLYGLFVLTFHGSNGAWSNYNLSFNWNILFLLTSNQEPHGEQDMEDRLTPLLYPQKNKESVYVYFTNKLPTKIIWLKHADHQVTHHHTMKQMWMYDECTINQ